MSDSIVENFLFDYVLRRENIQTSILSLRDTISSQNISSEDKKELSLFLVGKDIVDETQEIATLIQNYRTQKHLPVVYRLIVQYLESIIDIDDRESLNYLVSEKSDEIEVDIAIIFKEIVEDIVRYVQQQMMQNESFVEIFSHDYLSDTEKTALKKMFEDIHIELDEASKEKIHKIQEKIQTTIAWNKAIRDIQ